MILFRALCLSILLTGGVVGYDVPGEESDAALQRRLQILGEIRTIAQDNAKRVAKDAGIPPDVRQRMKATLPNTLGSFDLYLIALLCRVAQGDGPMEDHRYVDVFWEAQLHCAGLFIGRPDGLYFLKQLKCGTDGGTAEILDELIAKEQQRREKARDEAH